MQASIPYSSPRPLLLLRLHALALAAACCAFCGSAWAQSNEAAPETRRPAQAGAPSTGRTTVTAPAAATTAVAEPTAVPAGPPPIVPHRAYQPGETTKYRMTGNNRGWQYQIDAIDQVEQDPAGTFYEAIHWSQLVSNAEMTLSPASLNFQQTLSLAPPGKYLAVPDLSKVQPMLIGPITDLLTFYSDLYLATQYNLTAVGQHAYFAHGKPNSWANGQTIVLGEDAIDFAITLSAVDPGAHTATVLIEHVPPKRLQVKLPAAWMQQPIPNAPVSGAPSNWVQVERTGDAWDAEVGKESFAVELKVDTRSGKLLFAKMHNPVTLISRTCHDAALTVCDAATPHTILREVQLALLP